MTSDFSLYLLKILGANYSLVIILTKVSVGTSTLPIAFILFLPSFCFWRSFLFLLTSPQ